MEISDKKPLSRGEREIMEIVWDQGEAGVTEVTQILNRSKSVARTTVRTLLERVTEKGWLRFRVEGRSYLYSPTVPREESLGQRVMEMIDKACNGSPEKLMLALLHYRGLSEQESETIRKMLLDAKKNGAGK